MNDHSEQIAQRWTNKPYENLASCTTRKQAVLLQEVGQNAFMTFMIERLKYVLGYRHLNRVIDIACGTGEWTVKYLDFASKVVGIDINKNFLEVTKRNALSSPFSDRLEVENINVVDFNDDQNADLICVGSCFMYLNDEQADNVMSRISKSISKGGHVYFRATVTNPMRRSFNNSQGFYRTRKYYEDCFKKHGFRIIDSAYSATAIIHGLLVEGFKLDRNRKLSRLLDQVIHKLLMIKLLLFGRVNYMNWILKSG